LRIFGIKVLKRLKINFELSNLFCLRLKTDPAKKCMTQKSSRSDYKTNIIKALTTETTTISNTKCDKSIHQLNKAVGLKMHVTKMHKNNYY
jgi:hypothetical protein